MTKNDTNTQETGMIKLLGLFCDMDDFSKYLCLSWQQQLPDFVPQKRQCDRRITISEIMIIVINFICHITVVSKIINSPMLHLCTK